MGRRLPPTHRPVFPIAGQLAPVQSGQLQAGIWEADGADRPALLGAGQRSSISGAAALGEGIEEKSGISRERKEGPGAWEDKGGQVGLGGLTGARERGTSYQYHCQGCHHQIPVDDGFSITSNIWLLLSRDQPAGQSCPGPP